MNTNPKRYRLYIDESGDHTYSDDDKPEKNYLGLTGLVVESEYYRLRFQPNLESLKQKYFPHNPDEPVVLHRKELIGKRGPFWRLREPQKEADFNSDFLNFLKKEEYTLITVVIDKKSHVKRYGLAAFHPYHYCIVAMLERYCGFLNLYNAIGDVLAESRGGKEDLQLKEAYQRVYESGTQFRDASFFQKTLSSKEIKLKPKSSNISGTQIADLLAHPCKMELLFENKRIEVYRDVFGTSICKTIGGKHNRHFSDGRIYGYGKVFLS